MWDVIRFSAHHATSNGAGCVESRISLTLTLTRKVQDPALIDYGKGLKYNNHCYYKMSLRYGELNPALTQKKVNKEEVPPPKLPTYVYVVGMLAGTLTCLAFLPQVIKAVKTRTPSSLTWATLSICVVGQALWVAYGGLAKDKILIIFSMIALLLYLCLVGSKLLPFFSHRVTP